MILLQRVLISHHLLPTSSSHCRRLGWTLSPLSPPPLSTPSTWNTVTNPRQNLLGGHAHVQPRGAAVGPNSTPTPGRRGGCSPSVPVVMGVTDSCRCRSVRKDGRTTVIMHCSSVVFTPLETTTKESQYFVSSHKRKFALSNEVQLNLNSIAQHTHCTNK